MTWHVGVGKIGGLKGILLVYFDFIVTGLPDDDSNVPLVNL